MWIDTSFMIAGLFIAGAVAEPVRAHSPDPTSFLATQPPRFQSWRPVPVPGNVPARAVVVTKRRGRNALIGGAIGTVAGLTFCTVVSNLVNDPGSGFSTCTLKGYLLTGGVGFGLGFLIGLTV
jgi:hypothetical protein